MPAKGLDYSGKFNLIIIFLLSLSLATPVIHALGYVVPGFFGRFFFVALVVAVYALIRLFPALALSFPAAIMALGLLNHYYYPHLLPELYRALTEPRADSLHWPLLVMAGISLFFFILVSKLKKPLVPLLLMGLGSFAPLWYFYVDSAYPAAVAYAAGWVMLLSFKHGSRLWTVPDDPGPGREDAKDLRRSWINYTTAVLAMALLTALILPKNFAPLSWPAVQSWVSSRIPMLEELRSAADSGGSGSGSGEGYGYSSGPDTPSPLDGPLELHDTVLLEVRGRGGFYLRGAVFDTYTGTSWLNTGGSGDFIPFENPPEALSKYLVETAFRVRHSNLRTNTVFSILYPLEITGLPWEMLIDENTNITVPFSLPLNQEYRVRGFILDSRADIAALETGKEHRALDKFLQLPPGLPSRVMELALGITAAEGGYYDKIKALESFLKSTYTYNTETPPLPARADFVDFFLFDADQGYCTSFASALTVMARAAGVPARYVTGFRVPGTASEEGRYEVTGLNAHAWMEGYIPGVGWLPFEATPGFSLAPSPAVPDEPAGGGAVPVPVPYTDGLLDLDTGYLYPDPYVPGGGHQFTAEFLRSLARGLTGVLLTAAFAFCLVAAGRYLQVRGIIRRLDMQKPGLMAVNYYRLTLLFLDRLDAGKSPGETPREFGRRAAHYFMYPRALEFKRLSEGINLTLYSRAGADNPLLAGQARLFFRDVFGRYLTRVGKVTAFKEILIQRKYFQSKTKK